MSNTTTNHIRMAAIVLTCNLQPCSGMLARLVIWVFLKCGSFLGSLWLLHLSRSCFLMLVFLHILGTSIWRSRRMCSSSGRRILDRCSLCHLLFWRILQHRAAQSHISASNSPQEAKTGVRTSPHLTVIPQKNERKQGEQNETEYYGTQKHKRSQKLWEDLWNVND